MAQTTIAPRSEAAEAAISPIDDPFGDSSKPIPSAPHDIDLSIPVQATGPVCSTVPIAGEEESEAPPGARSGVFQKAALTNTWLGRIDDAGFGMDDLDLNTVWGLPCPTRASPLLITPDIAAHFLNGPTGLGLPAQVYDGSMEFRWIPRLSPTWQADIAVAPGYFSDFNNSSSKALRITGHGSIIWASSPTVQIVLGAAYLDRADVEVLPIAGFIWKPSDNVEYRLVFPYPKISRRVGSCCDPDPTAEHWVYVAGELGGGTWAIERSTGVTDLLTYSDWRLLLGIERRVAGGINSQIEAGFVFHRKIELLTPPYDDRPSDTVLVRAGLSY